VPVKRDGNRAVLGNSFPAGNKPRSEFIANVCFGHAVVHFFLLPLQLYQQAILLQGQNKGRALRGAENVGKNKKKRDNILIFISIFCKYYFDLVVLYIFVWYILNIIYC
jgi:hypothetical protein